MAGVLGFEPRNGGTKTRCLTAWLHPNNQIEFDCQKIIPTLPNFAMGFMLLIIKRIEFSKTHLIRPLYNTLRRVQEEFCKRYRDSILLKIFLS